MRGYTPLSRWENLRLWEAEGLQDHTPGRQGLNEGGLLAPEPSLTSPPGLTHPRNTPTGLWSWQPEREEGMGLATAGNQTQARPALSGPQYVSTPKAPCSPLACPLSKVHGQSWVIAQLPSRPPAQASRKKVCLWGHRLGGEEIKDHRLGQGEISQGHSIHGPQGPQVSRQSPQDLSGARDTLLEM